MKDNLFFCYSIHLKDFLKLQNMQYIGKYKHPNGNYYWTFEKSEELDRNLTKWEKYKEIFGQSH